MSPNPNLFVVGAPRTGTTALCAHLQGHADIFVSEPKEPYFWCEDFPGIRDHVGCRTGEQYRDLFRSAKRQVVRAEGSTLYLASDHAIARILDFDASSRFIVILRNPVELAYSFYSHLRFTRNEDCETFKQAWAIQPERADGRRIPSTCVEPKMLQYREIASIGSQLARMTEIVPTAQMLVLFQEEMREDARYVYQNVLRFLGLDDDRRYTIQRVNAMAAYRSGMAGRAIQSGIARRMSHRIKQCMPASVLRSVRVVKQQLLTAPTRRLPLAGDFRLQLEDELAGEVALVSALTGRNLDHWQPNLGGAVSLS
jgi:hypothetical protein